MAQSVESLKKYKNWSAKPRLRLTVMISLLTIGGAEQLLMELLKTIDRRRFDVNLLFLRGAGLLGKEFLQLGFPVQTDIILSRFDLLGIFRIARCLATSRTEVLLLINHRNTLFYGVLAAKRIRVPVIVNWENETHKRYSFHGLTMLGRRIMHLGIDKVVAAARGHKDYIAEVERIPHRKIVSIYNGVDPQRFASSLKSEDAKIKLGIPAQSPVVSIIAVLRPDKAHDVFLKAARLVTQSIPEAHFLIIGDGPQRNHLTQLAQTLGINANTHFLGFQRRLGDILAAVDINTLSSKPEQETLSVAAIEAMSVGIPIICTDVGFMREIVIPAKTGYLVPVGDPETLAARLIAVLQDRALLNRLGTEARTLVQRQLSVQHMTRNFENLFCREYSRKTGQVL